MQKPQSLSPPPRGAHSAPRWLFLLMITVLGLVGSAQKTYAQSTFAQIQGVVSGEENGKPLNSVTVVVNGPALQEFQSEVTDASGRYLITQLPPGDDYQVSFYFGSDDKPRVVRPGIRLSLGKTVTVNASIRLTAGKREVKVIKETAPNVDTASASTGVEINQEVLRNTPVRGRTFESVIALAPGTSDTGGKTGAAGGDVGVQISGSTGNENNFIIDGLNTSDPNKGVIGTELSQYFIKEINVITGGYQAEFGRATGGVVNIATKSGGNEFHGSVFGSYQPFTLDPRSVARLGEALATKSKIGQLYDFGFELGGPIWKDHIWFFVGFAPTFQDNSYNRQGRRQIFDANSTSASRAAVDTSFECPAYLASQRLCDGPRTLALRTEDLDYNQQFGGNKRIYNGIAKLQFNFNPDHNITLTYIGSPTTYDDYVAIRAVELESQRYTQTDQIHDAIFHYIGKVFDRKLQFDVLYGFHYQGSETTPNQQDVSAISWLAAAADPFSLHDFENVADCKRQAQMVGGAPFNFNPCPLTTYARGYGGYGKSTLMRHQALASATYFQSLTGDYNPFKGLHAFKLGFEFENLSSENYRTFSGTDLDPNNPLSSASGRRSYGTQPDGSIQIAREYATQNLDGTHTHLNGFLGTSSMRNYSLYLRDSWTVGWAPGLVLNLGVRWEGQELYGADKSRQIDIKDNWAPRIGIAYDFTQLTKRPGRSKIFFNYGRFYQSIPLNLADRQFTGEGLYSSDFVNTCANEKINPGADRGVPVPSAACNFIPDNQSGTINGGRYPVVSPGLKGQFINEIVLGLNYDIGWDVVVGASYIHRNLGNIIEDLSPNGGQFYIIANPGVQADPALVESLKNDIERLKPIGTSPTATDKEKADYNDALGRLDAYKQAGSVFPKAVRNYDALVLTMTKRLSNRFSVISSYTYARVMGNYPGTFSSSNGQNDPNISSQFDLTDLLANRNGPLPTDRPHNFKASGFYEQPLFGDKAKLTFGLTFSANSGRPIEVLGRHVFYGRREVYILPRGSGGRTPAVTQFDLHVGYEHKLTKQVALSIFADVVNLFNQQAVTNVDDEYTATTVSSILNGKISDLSRLKATNGTLASYNSNYGQATGYQTPLFFRFGGRLAF